MITPTVAHLAPPLAPLQADEALFVATSLLLAAPSAADDLLLRAALAVEAALLP